VKKDFPDFACRELNRAQCDSGCWEERAWNSWSSRLELEAKVNAKRLALEEGVHENEPELSLEVEKRNGKSCLRQL